MSVRNSIAQMAKAEGNYLTQTRRHIHKHPELSFQEYKTAAFIRRELEAIHIPYDCIFNTGTVAYIRGQNADEKTFALRADIDALPILEKNKVEYKSQNKGIMHACGHDVHTTCLLGAAKILNQIKSQLQGTLKLIFQPAEERAPGGAQAMIKEGVLNNPTVQKIIGQHVMPFLPVGKIGFREGKYMASADEIYITVYGKGGHGAMPERCIDPILIASQMIVGLQSIVSRGNPKIPSVVTFGKFIAEGATNVIPDSVYLEGTFRTLDEEWRSQVHEKLEQVIEGVVSGMGGKVDLKIQKGYPYLYNDPTLTQKMKAYATEYMGEENIVDLDLWMAAEDFAYYAQEIPACFYRLGTRNETKGITSSVHTPTFDVDEKALVIGAGLMAWLAWNEMN